MTDFIYDHADVRKVKKAASVTIYPNQYFTDFISHQFGRAIGAAWVVVGHRAALPSCRWAAPPSCRW